MIQYMVDVFLCNVLISFEVIIIFMSWNTQSIRVNLISKSHTYYKIGGKTSCGLDLQSCSSHAVMKREATEVATLNKMPSYIGIERLSMKRVLLCNRVNTWFCFSKPHPVTPTNVLYLSWWGILPLLWVAILDWCSRLNTQRLIHKNDTPGLVMAYWFCRSYINQCNWNIMFDKK